MKFNVNNTEEKQRNKNQRIAYFSMEIGVDSSIPTYSGGLGILAGDTIKSFADLNVPIIGVTLLYHEGYFFQKLEENGNQLEMPHDWTPADHMELLPNKVSVNIEGRKVKIQAWEYTVKGTSNHIVPIIFLDTDIEENSDYDRKLTDTLYGGDRKHRLCQEVVLGIGGVRMLKELGYSKIKKYHMNEGHAGLLTLELLNGRRTPKEPGWDYEGLNKMCVFTTHTPVPAGHDKFDYSLVQKVLGDFVPIEILKQMGGQDSLNMTLLALNLSGYENGVAKQHGKVSREMFPGYHIDSITNGIYSQRWVCECFGKLYDKYMPGWRKDPFTLRYALSIPRKEIWNTHMEAKKILIDFVNRETNAGMEYDTLTLGFARRATAYKRGDLIFRDINRLMNIADNSGKFQIIFAGKAHPNDNQGQALIKKIFDAAKKIKHKINVVYLENYDAPIAKMLVSGVDVWLNTPRRPQEASGTSGMKAAHNGIPSLSILDGWWIEGCIEGLTGWSIGDPKDVESNDDKDAQALYDKLEKIIIDKYYYQRTHWIDIMRRCIAINASFFNTHRMVQQYVLNAYLS